MTSFFSLSLYSTCLRKSLLLKFSTLKSLCSSILTLKKPSPPQILTLKPLLRTFKLHSHHLRSSPSLQSHLLHALSLQSERKNHLSATTVFVIDYTGLSSFLPSFLLILLTIMAPLLPKMNDLSEEFCFLSV